MVKGNQPGLLDNVSAVFTEGRHAELPRFEHLDGVGALLYIAYTTMAYVRNFQHELPLSPS